MCLARSPHEPWQLRKLPKSRRADRLLLLSRCRLRFFPSSSQDWEFSPPDKWVVRFVLDKWYIYVKKSRTIGCVIPHCKLQRRIVQPILYLFDISVQFGSKVRHKMLLFFLTADLHSEGILGVRDDEMKISASKKAFLSLFPHRLQNWVREREGCVKSATISGETVQSVVTRPDTDTTELRKSLCKSC